MYVSKTAWTVLSDFFSLSLKKQDGVHDPSESEEELRSQGSCKKELILRLCVNRELLPFKQTPEFCDWFAKISQHLCWCTFDFVHPESRATTSPWQHNLRSIHGVCLQTYLGWLLHSSSASSET